MDNGFFGNFFDFDGDGKLDMFESFLDFKAFEELVLNDGDDEGEEDE